MAQAPRRAAFLDRDGVVCIDRGYLHRREDFAFVPGALEGMRLLAQQGYLLTIVTNQSGIARGYFTEDDYAALTRHMVAALADAGIRLAGIRHCPHWPGADAAAARQLCDCRKPAPGMVLQLAQALRVDVSASVLVGDKAPTSRPAAPLVSGVACWFAAGMPWLRPTRRWQMGCSMTCVPVRTRWRQGCRRSEPSDRHPPG